MKPILFIGLFFCFSSILAQENRVKVFRDTRLVNSQTTELIPKGTMKFIISHRFGTISSGAKQLWGLDNSTIRIGLDYAVLDNLNIGFGRSSLEKDFDFFAKYRLLQQSISGPPLSIVLFTNASIKTIENVQTEELTFTNKLSYVYQLLLGRKLTDRLSFQLMPTAIHRNFVFEANSKNTVFSIGGAGRFQVSKSIAINLEYFYLLPDQIDLDVTNSAGLGIEFETRGHIFQLNFTNSTGLIAPLYVADTKGEIFNGDIHFGFNITRDFKIGSRKY